MENKKVCSLCGALVSKYAYNRHVKSCTGDITKFKGGERSGVYSTTFTGFCHFCNTPYDSYTAQVAHEVSCSLNPDRKSYLNREGKSNARYGKPAWNKGLTKENDERVKKYSETISRRMQAGIIPYPNYGRKLNDDQKEKVSIGMKLAHKEGRAWNIGMSRWNNDPSYPESFFMKVIANEFIDKNYIREFPFSKYSLDFAWEHKKKCIEIDGEQHERFNSVKERDMAKDRLLKEEGWGVLRIKWKDLYKDTKYYISVAKDFIGS